MEKNRLCSLLNRTPTFVPFALRLVEADTRQASGCTNRGNLAAIVAFFNVNKQSSPFDVINGLGGGMITTKLVNVSRMFQSG